MPSAGEPPESASPFLLPSAGRCLRLDGTKVGPWVGPTEGRRPTRAGTFHRPWSPALVTGSGAAGAEGVDVDHGDRSPAGADPTPCAERPERLRDRLAGSAPAFGELA